MTAVKNTMTMIGYAAMAVFAHAMMQGSVDKMFISFMIGAAAGFSALVLDAVC